MTQNSAPPERQVVLIGGESLLIECAQTLQAAGFGIAAVVSRAAAVRRWAASQKIMLFSLPSQLLSAEAPRGFGYLFSITNLDVLAPEVIALPTRAAINFHDGPLPEYAGLNTPVWALLNGEAQHGITWHLMTREVDRGDILAQRRFDLSDSESALTLNTRCFEAAIESFEQVARGLVDGTLAPRAQAGPPQRMYKRKDRPLGVIDWSQPAVETARLVRALDFGAYANPVASAKLLTPHGVLIVARAEVTEQRSAQPAGTVTAVDATAITVATSDHDLHVTALQRTCGSAIDLLAAAHAQGLRVGTRLPSPDAAQHERLAATAAHEPFWQQLLETQDALELPVVDRTSAEVVAGSASIHSHVDVVTPAALEASQHLASVLAWLARCADKSTFDVGFGVEADSAGLWAAQVPWRASIDVTNGLNALAADCAAQRQELLRRGSYLRDLVARRPDLRARAAQRDPRVLPVALLLVDRLDDARAEPGSELTVALARDGSASRWLFDTTKLSAARVASLQQQWRALSQAAAATPERAIAELPLMDAALQQRVLHDWNAERADGQPQACVHHLFEAQATHVPQRTALVAHGAQISYAELEQRANRVAAQLVAMGVGPDVLVGLCLPRGIELVVGLLAIHKAGGAYVPLDPAYPRDRIAYMLEDAKAAVLITDRVHGAQLQSQRVLLIEDALQAESSDARIDGGAKPEHLAYVIYTSGSTGKPKGVMVEHRNVVNFFAGMDQHLDADFAGTWLAVTSLSFDISVLELCWTLARGYTVVVASEEQKLGAGDGTTRGAHASRKLDFSLFYFSADENEGGQDKYRLLLEGAKYADKHGFSAVWTPERHFHAFGGLYPNPAVAGAAVAAVTEHVGIRAGSVVLPLHHPARVAEEWSVVDNISKGRVGISFASGWQPNDFALMPGNYADNKNVMLRNIEVVRKLWRGESVAFDGPLGKPVELRTLPRPVQKELPYWVTSAGNPQTFIEAGRIGANVLTHLLGQTVEELAEKIAAYRKAYKEAGHAGEGFVSLMLHSFVGPDMDVVRATVKQPLIAYLKTSLNLVKQYAWSFPAFKRPKGVNGGVDVKDQGSVDLQSLAPEEMDALLEYSFERYFDDSGLFGTPESCLSMIDRIKAVGVDDVACLIDFGIASDTVLAHLPHLNALREQSMPAATSDASLADLMQRHRVTHLQCTPSMARMLAADDAARVGLSKLHCMMVGGEAFPPTLARDLAGLVQGKVMNMYGPTESTIWSAVHTVGRDASGVIPLGKPLANQQVHILDSRLQPLPPGVPGELAIGGDGVVRGYFQRPELTAERFVPNTIRGQGRLYRTGDLARWRDDGVLEFLGRLDHQVKVRGYRIELGEIEAALAEQPGVAQAVVIAREDQPGDARLVAYLVGTKLDGAALREALRARLPDFMLPSAFVMLDDFPHTPNGKIDRKALPAPDAVAATAPTVGFVAPTSDLESQIADVWKDVLKLATVGTRDNFFDLGGHSLLAVQAHRRLKETLQRDLSITDIFRFPTIQSLATYLAEGSQGGAQQGSDRAQGRRAAMQRRQQQRSGAPATTTTTR